MNEWRGQGLRARSVSLRRSLRSWALILMVGGLLATSPALAQQGEPSGEEPPAGASNGAPAPGGEATGAGGTGVEGQAPPAETETSTSSEVARLYAAAGRSYYKNGQYAEAIDEFRKAYDLVPNGAMAYNIARCHERLSQWKDAIEWYEVYVKKAADPKERAETLEKIEALKLKIGIGGVEAQYRARMKAGQQKYKAGDYESAIEEFRAAFDIKAAPAPLYNIAKSYENMGRYEEAADYYQQYPRPRPQRVGPGQRRGASSRR